MPYGRVIYAELPQFVPFLFFLERPRSVERQERRQLPETSQIGDFAQQQRAHFDGEDTPGQTVGTRFNSQRGTAGDEYSNRIHVHELLELRSPIRQVLNLVKEYERLFAGVGRGIESLPEDGF